MILYSVLVELAYRLSAQQYFATSLSGAVTGAASWTESHGARHHRARVLLQDFRRRIIFYECSFTFVNVMRGSHPQQCHSRLRMVYCGADPNRSWLSSSRWCQWYSGALSVTVLTHHSGSEDAIKLLAMRLK